jgi:hypothetical protein
MDNDWYIHRGELLWYDQTIPEWISPYVANKTLTSSLLVTKLKIKLLNRHQVLRYCSIKSNHLHLEVIPDGGSPYTDHAVALHCFVWTHGAGHVGEQGRRKSSIKENVMKNLHYWVLKEDHESIWKNWQVMDHPLTSSNHRNMLKGMILDKFSELIDKVRLTKFQMVWLKRNHSVSDSILVGYE